MVFFCLWFVGKKKKKKKPGEQLLAAVAALNCGQMVQSTLLSREESSRPNTQEGKSYSQIFQGFQWFLPSKV